MRLVSLIRILASFGLFLAVGCAKVNDGALPPGSGTGGSPPPRDAAREPMPRPDRGPAMLPRACGNGERTSDEACDDGNTTSGDGCAADCLTVEPGYSCTPPGS